MSFLEMYPPYTTDCSKLLDEDSYRLRQRQLGIDQHAHELTFR
jgi:hypothetical protein